MATYGTLGMEDELYVRVIERTDFSFDGRAVGAAQSITLTAGIPSVSWVSAVLVTRLHAKGTFSATAAARVVAENISLVPEEPNVIFGNDIALATASVALATVVPSLQVVALSGAIGHMLQVRLLFDQGGTAAGAAQTMSISVDLVGRVG